MFFGLYLILIIYPLFVTKISKHYDLFVIVITSLISHFASDKLADFAAMEAIWEAIKSGIPIIDAGIGWFALCRLSIICGIPSYKILRTLLFIISLLFIRSTIRYFVKDNIGRARVWGCFLVFPVLLEGIQARYFFAESIILFALRFLVSDKHWKHIIYILTVFLVSTIHSSALFYLLLWLCLVVRRIRQIVPIVAGFGSCMLLFGKRLIIGFAGHFVNPMRIEAYFYGEDGTGPIGFLVYAFFIFSFIIIGYYLIKNVDKTKIEKEQYRFLEIFYVGCLSVLILLPMTLIANDFFRLQRPFWIMLYISIAFMGKCNVKSIGFDIGRVIRFNLTKTAYVISLIGNLLLITINGFNTIQGYFF